MKPSRPSSAKGIFMPIFCTRLLSPISTRSPTLHSLALFFFSRAYLAAAMSFTRWA